jgi:hypothetical protein
LRDHLGLRSDAVEVTADGAGLHVEPLAGESLDKHDGRFAIPASGAQINDAVVRKLRDADQLGFLGR